MKRKISKLRVNKIFIFIFFFSFLVALIKLGYVALSDNVDGLNLTEFANNRNTEKKTLYASRGTIYDRNKEVIATNANSYTLIAYLSESRTTDPKRPQHVVDKEKTAQALADILGMDYDYALERLNVKGAYQVEFGAKGHNISENKKQDIDALALPGIDFVEGIKRYYKNSKMASYIVGYAKANDDGEIVGEMGIESYYNDILKGTDGYTEYQKGASGYPIGEPYRVEPVSGSDIYLTLDSGIQLILEDAVHNLEENNHYTWFTISVMDAKTGAIVGSTSSPSFNPNTLEGLTNYVNPLVGYTYEPGSTMKIFSWLAAMENGVYDGDEKFMSGTVKVAGATIKDFNNTGWGEITFDTGFAYSSNVGATYLAKKVGAKKLREFYESLGFGSKTGIELPGEEAGVIRMTYESELATASFGQGITTTPIQTLQALSIIANDGVMLKPYIVDKIVNANGEVTYTGKKTELGKKVSSESIKKMQELMYNVVYHGASNDLWQPDNVTLIGKTGTAQIASASGGYLSGAGNFIRSFAGIFPGEDPQYILYASAKQIDGGAAPVATVVKKVVESIANYVGFTSKKEDVDLSQIIKIDNYLSNDVNEVSTKLVESSLVPIVIGNGSKIINQFPLKDTQVLQDSKVFLLTESPDYTMPDIKDWTTSEVISFCNLIGLKYNFTGFGRVKEYSIAKDTIIDLNSTLEVSLIE